jgi:hypothetical protein
VGDWLLEAAGKLVGQIFVTLILMPPVLLLATPVILIRSLFWPGRIRADYAAVIDCCWRYL